MKTRVLALLAVVFFASSINSFAEKYVSKSYKIDVLGTSTIHDWTVPATQASSTADLNVSDGVLEKINFLSFDVVTASLKSSKGGSMDEKIQETLKAEDFAKITYKLSNVKSINKTADGFDVDSKGTLSIAGSSQSIDMNVVAKVLGNGDVEFKGSRKLKFSDFGMKRPSAMLGTIKAGEEITVNFNLVMKKN